MSLEMSLKNIEEITKLISESHQLNYWADMLGLELGFYLDVLF